MFSINEYQQLIKKKYLLQKDMNYDLLQMYLQGLQDELHEVKNEIRENNQVYLEDELGDILWDYMNILHVLEDKGLIADVESVLTRSMQKYKERVDVILQSDRDISQQKKAWDTVKEKQKQDLKQEHDALYHT